MELEKKVLNNLEKDCTDKDNVSLFYNDALYQGYGRYNYNIYIRVKNIGFEKSVVLHYNDGDGWKEADGEYINSLTVGTFDIFKVSLRALGSIKYYITYTVNGKTYKDDNDKKNYRDEVLGTAPMCAARSTGLNDVYLRVKKYDENKKVFVHYTTDNWESVKSDIELTKVEEYSDGTELWKATLDAGTDIDSVKYTFYLSLYGSVYWDNNFGNNYDGSFVETY